MVFYPTEKHLMQKLTENLLSGWPEAIKNLTLLIFWRNVEDLGTKVLT